MIRQSESVPPVFAVEDSVPSTMLRLVEQQCLRTPHKVAVVCGSEELTYDVLRKHSNQLAHHLRHRGIVPETPVALCLDRSVMLPVCLLGILKAGGAYVPLDPEYPPDRLGYILEDSSAPLLITEHKLFCELFRTQKNVLCLDDRWQEISREEEAFLPVPALTERSLAYIVYTSGSTGQPKGVMIEHAALANLLESMAEQITDSDTVLAVASLSFDVAGLELFLPLTVGARLVIAPSSAVRDGRALRHILEQSRATIMRATPGRWKMLLEAGWRGGQHVKVHCGGEPLSAELAKELLARAKCVWNEYGPTETTVCSSMFQVATGLQTIPIGRPIANTEMYVLNDDGAPVSNGEIGELCIGGAGLARGYWRRPDLTAERFIPNPFGVPPSRLYRTGDLARVGPNGDIEYVGRLDGQVKVRGYRVELGEIEAVLRNHAAVSDAVVMLRRATSQEGLLTAYFVPATGTRPSPEELRAHLKKSLPEYMVPAIFVPLPEFKLTPNGKIDRQGLPAVSQQDAAGVTDFAAPESETERKLAEIFERILQTHPISVSVSFFDLGGDSLLALKLSSQISKSFGKDLPVSAVFEAPSVQRLAALLDQHVSSGTKSLVPIQPDGTLPPLFFIHSPSATHQALAALLGPEQPLYGFQQRGLDGQGEPHTRIEDMAAHYIAEMRNVRPHGPYHLAGACLGGVVAFEMAQQLRLQREDVGLVLLVDCFLPGKLNHFRDDSSRSKVLWRLDRKIGEILLEAAPGPLGYTVAFRNVVQRIRQERRRARALANIDQANANAMSTYVALPYPGRLVLFWATDAVFRAYQDRRLAWADIAEQGLEVHVVPGNHLSIMEPPQLAYFAETLKQCLKKSVISMPSTYVSAPTR